MKKSVETTIVKQLYRLDERKLLEVLDFVEFLTVKKDTKQQEIINETDWPQINPSHDLSHLIGSVNFKEDGVAYQRRIRDEEWS